MRACVLACLAVGCNAGGPTRAPHPPPEVYEEPSDFAGKWRGEIEGIGGVLRVDRLSDGRYYANFRARDRPERYILSMAQTEAELVAGELQLANLCEFTWQDGRGSVGAGWLLINRESTTLTGTFGRGSSMSGMGVLTFVRAE